MKYLDVACAIIGIVVSLVVIIVLVAKSFQPIYLVAVGIGLLCVMAYIIFRKWLLDEKKNNIAGSFWFWMLGAIVCWCGAIAVFLCRPDQHIKPLGYYILSAVAIGLAFVAVLVVKWKVGSYVAVIFACCVGLAHIWTENVMFPNSLIGSDPWVHLRTTVGYLGLAGQWGNPPLNLTTIGVNYSMMYVYLRWVMNLFSLDYKMASLIFVGSLLTVGNLILVYFIGRKLFNDKVGAVASLVLAVSNWGIFAGEWIIPNSIGAVLSLAIFYMIIKVYKDRMYWLIMPILVVTYLGYATHLIAAAWVTGTICCIAVLPFAFNMVRGIREWAVGVLKVLPVAIVALICFGLWMRLTTIGGAVYTSFGQYGFEPSSGLTYAVGKAPEVVPPSGTPVTIVAGNVSSPVQEPIPIIVHTHLNGNSFGELLWDSIGMFLYMGLSLVGVLMMLRKEVSPLAKSLAVLGVAVLAVGFAPPLFGVSLIEHRWWYFAEVLLAVPLGVVLVQLSKKQYIAVAVLVSFIAFASTIGLPSNMTNRTLSPNLIVRYALTQGEMQGLQVAESYNPKCIGSDPLYLCYVSKDIKYMEYGKMEVLGNSIVTGNFTGCRSDLLLLRDALYREPFGYGSGEIYTLGYNPIEVALRQGYKEVWENGEIHVLVRI